MILLLAGTSDARELAVLLAQAGHRVLATVVTDSAAKSLADAGIAAAVGRLDAEALAALIRREEVLLVVDASHPFAEEASRNAMAASKAAAVPYVRYEREGSDLQVRPGIVFADDYAHAAELAAVRGGVVMLTTGSKTLHVFARRLGGLPDVRLVARMLPRLDNMEKCEELGIEQRNIVAMQGPFSKELNKALYAHYGVTLMITKESGKIGAVDEKLEAALEMGIETIVIGRPGLEYGIHFSDYEGVLKAAADLLQEVSS
ncbi:precorrin-6A reductase [Paenibacillus chitinolyticus]|uniref:Precorrin-6A reductase n=1 Tax=Paenibacillus chitinolyticus TaxID=79263 RepID=A0A410X2T3_9BACL|nr:precorrin-6A reductase [Paenibacillus chitinolyticus]MCY9593836.1 precorrin-6A reductase [Paenibacillus chitinolyticus]MCY9599341.1 precorrin-6A reductase [Paenibacillus chitinolyticus]QAV20901.1 precorrin-6A reductase [Paenibacillus chitinolyticus]